VRISALNASWALAVSELALTSTPVRTPQGFFGQGGGGGRGGGGGGVGRGGRGSRHGGRGGHQGRGGYQQGFLPVCNDFLKGKCNRPVCKLKH
jgi:hypothetical protein